MHDYGGWIIIVSILITLLAPSVYYSYKGRNDGKFDIRIVNEKYELWYCHRCEWMIDSIHDTRNEAIEQINVYVLRKAEQNIRCGIK